MPEILQKENPELFAMVFPKDPPIESRVNLAKVIFPKVDCRPGKSCLELAMVGPQQPEASGRILEHLVSLQADNMKLLKDAVGQSGAVPPSLRALAQPHSSMPSHGQQPPPLALLGSAPSLGVPGQGSVDSSLGAPMQGSSSAGIGGLVQSSSSASFVGPVQSSSSASIGGPVHTEQPPEQPPVQGKGTSPLDFSILDQPPGAWDLEETQLVDDPTSMGQPMGHQEDESDGDSCKLDPAATGTSQTFYRDFGGIAAHVECVSNSPDEAPPVSAIVPVADEQPPVVAIVPVADEPPPIAAIVPAQPSLAQQILADMEGDGPETEGAEGHCQGGSEEQGQS